MKKIICLIVIFIAVNSFCFAEENKQNKTKEKNMETIVYIHPYTGVFSSLSGKPSLYLTIENPLNLSKSLIIKPSMWINVSEPKIYGKSPEFSRLGSDIGIRHYTNKKGDGFYLQGSVGLFYIYRKNTYDFSDVLTDDITADIMGYLGYSWKFSKWSIFWDFGFGYGNNPLWDKNFIPDMNFGVGLKF